MDWVASKEVLDENHGVKPTAPNSGTKLVKDYKIEVERLDNCSICHR